MLQKMLAQNQFEYYRAIYLSLKFPRDFEILCIKTKDRTTLYKRSNQLSNNLSTKTKNKERKEKVTQNSPSSFTNFNYNGRLTFNQRGRSFQLDVFPRDDRRAFQAQHVARTLLHREERGAPFGIKRRETPSLVVCQSSGPHRHMNSNPVASHVATPTVIDKARSINETNSRRVTPTRI